ncbi:MAG: hypothetical protein MUP30_03010 [Deltaproteobacteria bacterium]|nr:hypothetical protein [Deltaproteobacteria bacterium]
MRIRFIFSFLLITTVALVINAPLLALDDSSQLNNDTLVRQFCDSLAADLVKADAAAIRLKMTNDFKEYYNPEQFTKRYYQIAEMYGQVKEYNFKMVGTGVKMYFDGRKYPMKKIWYAVTTTKHKMGECFLFIEVIAEGSHLASSGFSFVMFTGDIPDNLK